MGVRARIASNLNIPNLLSVLRLLLIPVFVIIYFSDIRDAGIISALILIFSGLTDVADGIIARKFNMTTALGRILDPLADKMTQATVCICLVLKQVAPLWLLILFIVKEILMIAGGANIIRKRKAITSSKWFGKLATVVFYMVMISIIAFNLKGSIVDIMLIVALAFMLFSFGMYIPIFLQLVRKEQ